MKARGRRRAPPAPNPADLTSRGVALYEHGRFAEAVGVFEHVTTLQPLDPAAHLNLGIAYKAGDRPLDALASLAQAVALAPEVAETYGHLADVLLHLGRTEEAIAVGARAVALAPREPWAHVNLGVALQKAGRLADAIASFRRGLELAPQSAVTMTNLGSALEARGQVDEAVECYEQAFALGLRTAEAYANLARGRLAQGRADEAVTALRGARDLAPDIGWDVAIAAALPVIPRSREQMMTSRRALDETLEAVLASTERLRAPDTRRLGPNFYLAYHGLNDRELQGKMAAVCLHTDPTLAWTAPHCVEPGPPADRLRVGFVSRYLTKHSIGFLTHGLVRELSRARMDVLVFHVPGPRDDVSAAIDASADRAVRLSDDLAAARRQIADEALDVLLYPEIGMDTFTYQLAFSRLAPAQCVTWGHPVTTGIPTIDHFLSSVDLEPEGAEAHYTERLHRLSRLPACYPRPSTTAPPDRARLGLDAAATLYVCPQSVFKLHPDFDAVAAELLRRDERGQLVLIEGTSRHWSRQWRERFGATAPDVSDRVRFLPRLALADFLCLLQVADALLDSFPFAGGTTSYNALGLGVPIVTWPGAFMRGRVTYACYRQLGVLDCVADTAERYVELARRLANDRPWRDDIAARITAAQAELFDDVRAVREIEDFLVTARADAARLGAT